MASVYRAYMDPTLPDDYFRVEVIILRALGLELMREETFWYKIYSKLILFFIVILLTAVEAYEIYAQWGDLDTIVEVCHYLITHVKGAVKVYLLYTNRKEIGNMMKSFHEPPFKPDVSRGGHEEEVLIRDVIRKTETGLFIYFISVAGVVFTGPVKVTITHFTKPREEWKFPFAPTMTILDFSDSPWYEVGCAYQSIGVISYAGIIATTYVLLSTILAHISVQMKILGNAFRNIVARARKMKAENNEKSLEECLNIVMKETIEYHLQTLELAAVMERLCSNMILVVFLASVVLLCFLFYSTSMYPFNSMQFLQCFSYCWILAFQVGMYCYWGNEVTLEAFNVTEAIADMEWVDSPQPLQKAVIMITARAQIPLYITAGRFVPASMTTFMSIIKGSFSYFMVLRQRQEEI